MSYNCAYVESRWLTYCLFKRTYIRCPMSRSNFEAVVMDTVYAAIPRCNFSFQCNKLKKKYLFKQERDSYSSFNRASFVTFVTAKVTI